MSQDKRSAIYVTWNAAIAAKVDAIAAAIIAMAPTHPLFPRPLRPLQVTKIEAGEYDAGQVAECCARLLAQHLADGVISKNDLQSMVEMALAEDKAANNLIKAHPLATHVNDLLAIASAIQALGIGTGKGTKVGVNLKLPADVAILYAYQVVSE
jgi:hypothetical protein